MDCDPWAEPGTTWHQRWQEQVPAARREVIVGNHRADILTADGTFVELQHSNISAEDIQAREGFYRRMIWVFDATEAVREERLNIRRRPGKPYMTFRWKHPRKSVGVCRQPVILDLGDGLLLRLGRIHLSAPCGGWGHLLRATDFIAWMNAVPLAQATA